MKESPNKTIEEAWKELFNVIIEALKIDKFVEWLNNKLK